MKKKMKIKIQLESGQRNHDDQFKLDIYLRITQLQLEYDDSVSAEGSLRDRIFRFFEIFFETENCLDYKLRFISIFWWLKKPIKVALHPLSSRQQIPSHV